MELFTLAGFIFTNGLHNAITSASPPSIAFFEGLPSAPVGVWGVYAHVLKKTGAQTLVYVGSGTATKYGVRDRLRHYTYDRKNSPIPLGLSRALDDGYSITNSGLLLQCPIPQAKDIPILRAAVVAIKSALLYMFWTHESYSKDNKYKHLCPWYLFLFSYGGLCTYYPLWEDVLGDFRLTGEQREEIAAINKKKRQDYQYIYDREQRERSPDRIKAVSRNNSRRRQKSGLRQAARKAIKDSKKFHCNFCNISFPEKYLHARHDNSKRHKATVAKAIKMGKSPS
ncbi:MAG: hypothetical protein Q9174_005868 [Haloplaca sp. 1 TL-2023]